MAGPLVSVLIPARNAGRWLGDTLESALAQTWPALEVIVAEGGSADDTRAVARRYATRGVVLLEGGPTLTAAMNRNRAAAAAKGEFFQFLDADDLLAPDKIRAQVEQLVENRDCVSAGDWARFYRTPDEARFTHESVGDLGPCEWLIRAWAGGEPMMQPGLWLIPREVAGRAGPWDEELTLIDDFEYFTRIVLASRQVRHCAQARLYYRSGNPGSLASQRSPAAWRSAWRAIDRGTAALLARTRDPAARAACADILQRLAFDAFLEDDDVAKMAESRANELGGASAVMTGGVLFRALRRAVGWKGAKRIKRSLYKLGYGRLAALKEAALAGDRSR
jgi:glycosyltransferase involved in cell wall biosynthesis